jgi:hypothetical protein
VTKLVRAWEKFWFESDGTTQMRFFRSGLGALLFCCYAIRSLDLEFYFSDAGFMKRSLLADLLPMTYRLSIFQYFTSSTALWVGNTVLLVSLLAMTFGIFPRVATIVAEILHISFLHRNMTISYGVDTMSAFFLFYLCFADYKKPDGGVRSAMGSMAYRLSQVQLCVIYGYSGLHKLQGQYWWKGDGVWSVLANFQMARWDFSYMAHFPMLLAFMSFASLFWEIYFPALIWVRPLRYPMLVFGVLLHLGIAVGINIPFFGLLMMITYLLFVDAQHLNKVEEKFEI